MADAAKWQSYGFCRWRRHSVPVLVWLGAVSSVGWLVGHRSERIELVGIARGEQRQIAALSDGRLAMVPVRLFEPVQSGQILAVLEDDRIRAALATAAAESARLQAELKATEARLAYEAGVQELEYAAEARRFAVDVEQTRLDALELTVAIETGRITVQRLQIELDRLRGLRLEHAASQLEFELAETEYGEAVKEVEENEKTLAQLKQDLQLAVERRDTFGQHRQMPAALGEELSLLRAAVSVQESRIAELALQRATLVLYSPLDGIVGEMLRGVGEIVQPGEPILTVVATRPSDVIAYVTAADAKRINVGAPLELGSLEAATPAQRLASQVIAVGPAIVQLPQRLWRNPAAPEWGCPVRLSIPAGVRLRCEELVAVHIPHQGKLPTDARDVNDRPTGVP